MVCAGNVESALPKPVDSRESGNDDTKLAAEIHGVVRLKWYKEVEENK